jgi:ligand-binding sensor domain-containing protein
MKILVYPLFLFLALQACERAAIPDTFPAEFNTRILEDYFVSSIAFEGDGTAWIGTFKQGLIRYHDGDITVFDASNSPVNDTLVIRSIAADGKGNVWIGCGGLIHYNGTDFSHYTSENSPIPVDLVDHIALDSRDVVWFSSSRFREGGLVRFNGTAWDVYTPENSPLPEAFIHGICIDRLDNIWIAPAAYVDEAFLVRKSGAYWKEYSDKDLGFSPYYFGSMEVNSRNEIFVSIDYTLSSLWQHPGPDMFRFNGITCEQIHADSLRSHVKFISIDRNDRVWCAGFGQYRIYDRGNWSHWNNSFQGIGIFAIEQAPDGKMWIGTGEGIYISD